MTMTIYRFNDDPAYIAVREMALDLFKTDCALCDDFFAEILTDSVSDELLKETGCWAEAEKEYQDKLAG